MKIIAQTDIEVTLSEKQLESIAMDYLCRSLNWQSNFFIKDEKVCHPIYFVGSHSWEETKIVRDATEEDYFAAGVLKILKR